MLNHSEITEQELLRLKIQNLILVNFLLAVTSLVGATYIVLQLIKYFML